MDAQRCSLDWCWLGSRMGKPDCPPRRQRRLVEAWAELHQHELIDDWHRLQGGQVPLPIAPLE